MGLLKWFAAVLATCATLATSLTKLVELFLARIVNLRRGLPRRDPELAEPGHKVNDSLYELYKPDGTPSMQILFFHGLKFGVPLESHMWTTWQSGDRSCIWPQKWLAEEFPNAQIFLVSYDGSVRNNFQYSPDIYIITENLTSDFLQGDIGQIPKCPVILVGHCCGGIVIKELCLRVHKMLSFTSERAKLKNFLYNIKGIFYYSTPHHGVSMLNNEPTVENNPLLTYFQTMSKDAKRLNQEFGQLHKVHAKWKIHGVGTNVPTNLGRLGNIEIGFEVSGRDGDSYNVIHGVDHYAICKPQDKKSRSYYALTNLVKTIANDPEVVHLCHDLQDFCPGLENLVQAVEKKLKNKKVIAIVGMGGVGKTTLAKKLFNNISREYEYTCFLDNVKGIPGSKLSRELLDEFYCNGIGVKSNQMDWSHLKGKKILLVMDDVDSVDQLNCLPASLAAFGNDSHLIITSRDQDILKHPKVYADSEIYDVDLLGDADAKKLFCYHAFGSENIPANLVENVERIVRKCQGLPLTLEVLGCYLRGCEDSDSDLEIWKETIDKLGEAEAVQGGEKDDRVWARLRISYDRKLSQKEQEMFIDAATFFFGQPLEQALVAWSTAYGSPHSSWKNLLSTCLVKVKARRTWLHDGWPESEIMLEEVWVHEHLRDLANKISKAEVSAMMDAVDNTSFNTDSLRLWKNGLRLLRNRKSKDRLQLDLLDKMENLKYLEVEVSPTGWVNKFPRKLSLLSWEGDADEDSRDLLPINLEELSDLGILELSQVKVLEEFSEALGSLKNLHTLSLSSLRGIHHLPTNFGKLSRLKRLKLRRLSIPTLPDSFGDLRALEYLQCEWLGLLELPESFGSLSLLKHLILREESLKSLPKSFSKLLTLERLEIRSDSLKELGDSFGKLRALNWLKINCKQLKTLPESFVQLLALRRLEIKAKSLKKLPDNFGHLSALEELELVGCEQLKSLPENFGELSALRRLEIYAGSVERLLDSFARLSALEELKLVRWQQLKSLPENFGELSALRSLTIVAKSLEKLPDSFGRLSALEKLDLSGTLDSSGCEQLKTLPDNFGKLLALRSLKIRSKSLEKLSESFGRLVALEELHLDGCEQLKSLPEKFGELLALRSLKIRAKSLEKLSDSFRHLAALEELHLDGCEQLKSLPENFGELLALRKLIIVAKSLEKLPDSFGRLSTLEELRLQSDGFGRSGCEQLKTTPENFAELLALRSLTIDAKSLEKLPDSFGRLSALKELHLRGYEQLKSLPENSGELLALRSLMIDTKNPAELPDSSGRLCALEELPDSFGGLCTLEELYLVGCEQLKILPESLGGFLALRSLRIAAKSLPDSFGRLPALEELRVSVGYFGRSGCEQLKTLPENFGELLALRILHINAKRLEKLPDNFGGLSALEELKLTDCEQLQRLPDDFGQLKALKTLNIFGAGQLKVLPDNFRQLVALKELWLSGEVALEVLDHIETLGNFSSLEVLKIWDCPTLETLPESVGHISSLRSVGLWKCPRIKNLPDSLGKPRLPQLAIPQQDSPVEGQAPKTTATEGVRLRVRECPLLDASALQRLGWVKSKDDEDIYQRRSESD